MRIIKLLGLAAGLLWICSGGSEAGTLLEPGETVGIPTGAPLPQGFYFVDTLGYTPDARQLPSGHLAMNIPVFVWVDAMVILRHAARTPGCFPDALCQ